MENAHLALEQAKEELTYLYTFFARAYINNIINIRICQTKEVIPDSVVVSKRSVAVSFPFKVGRGGEKSRFFVSVL